MGATCVAVNKHTLLEPVCHHVTGHSRRTDHDEPESRSSDARSVERIEIGSHFQLQLQLTHPNQLQWHSLGRQPASRTSSDRPKSHTWELMDCPATTATSRSRPELFADLSRRTRESPLRGEERWIFVLPSGRYDNPDNRFMITKIGTREGHNIGAHIEL